MGEALGLAGVADAVAVEDGSVAFVGSNIGTEASSIAVSRSASGAITGS